MSTAIRTPTTTARSEPRSELPPALWRWTGAGAIAHVVLLLVGIALSQPALFADGTAGIREDYAGADLTRSMSGGLIEAYGFLLMIPTLVLLARAFGTSPVGRFASQCGLACGLGYVFVTFAVGFPAGAASLYGAHQGLDLEAAFAINNIRIFGYFLSLMLLGGSALGISAAALSGSRSRWMGLLGAVVGAFLLVAPVLARWNLHDLPSLVWMVWWVGLGVILLRGPRTAEPRTPAASVGQA